LYVAFDARRSNPEMAVMKWGFVLVTLFMGPLGACIYILSCKPPCVVSMPRSSTHYGSRPSDPRSTASQGTRLELSRLPQLRCR
jgi:hypothetical protein